MLVSSWSFRVFGICKCWKSCEIASPYNGNSLAHRSRINQNVVKIVRPSMLTSVNWISFFGKCPMTVPNRKLSKNLQTRICEEHLASKLLQVTSRSLRARSTSSPPRKSSRGQTFHFATILTLSYQEVAKASFSQSFPKRTVLPVFCGNYQPLSSKPASSRCQGYWAPVASLCNQAHTSIKWFHPSLVERNGESEYRFC